MEKVSNIPIFRSECPPGFWIGTGIQHVFLELTPACNNRCPGCLNESYIADFANRTLKERFRHPILNQKDWLSVLARMPATVKLVTLSGGEPTLHPDFIAILNELENQEKGYTIFSNGRWPDPVGLITVLQNSQHFQGFLISLHGVTAPTHELFTGNTHSFEETIINIRKATNAKLPVTLSTVVTHQNLNELEQIPVFALQLGVKDISFNRYLNSPDRVIALERTVAPPTPEELRIAIQKVESLRTHYSEQLHISYGPTIPQCFEASASQGCSAGDASLVIDPWGNVRPCLHVDLMCGNILQQEFDNIWSGEQLRMWRGLTSEACSTCTALSSCGGGCRAMALSWGGVQDPLMELPVQRNFIRLSDVLNSSAGLDDVGAR